MENDAHVNLKGVEKAEMEMEGGKCTIAVLNKKPSCSYTKY